MEGLRDALARDRSLDRESDRASRLRGPRNPIPLLHLLGSSIAFQSGSPGCGDCCVRVTERPIYRTTTSYYVVHQLTRRTSHALAHTPSWTLLSGLSDSADATHHRFSRYRFDGDPLLHDIARRSIPELLGRSDRLSWAMDSAPGAPLALVLPPGKARRSSTPGGGGPHR